MRLKGNSPNQPSRHAVDSRRWPAKVIDLHPKSAFYTDMENKPPIGAPAFDSDPAKARQMLKDILSRPNETTPIQIFADKYHLPCEEVERYIAIEANKLNLQVNFIELTEGKRAVKYVTGPRKGGFK